MAGGTWTAQNKVRPGVYINYKSAAASIATMGERGTVVIPKQLSWGEVGKFITIESPDDCMTKLGYSSTDEKMLFVREILRGTNRTNGAKKILIWRLECDGAKAATATGQMPLKAKQVGARGNDLTVSVAHENEDEKAEESNSIVTVYLGAKAVETIVAPSTTKPKDISSDWVEFTTDVESETLESYTGVSATLSGGSDGTTADVSIYDDFIAKLRTVAFDVLIYDGADTTLKSTFASFVKSQSNDEGMRCQCVLSDYASADNECTISCAPQALTLDTGEALTAEQLTWWVGGASAGANVFESLTYSAHPAAVDIEPKYTKSEQEAHINAGDFALIAQYDKVQVLTDINSFTTFAVEKGKAFRKNRVVRTVFGLCNDIYKAFSLYYIGAVHNDEEGRKSLKAEILNIMNQYQGNRALQNVVADDVTVSKGTDSDAVIIEINCQPVDSIEKIYINITIS